MKSCGTYAPIIYSLSLTYNPLEDKNISLKETFTKNKVGTKDSTNVEATSRNLSSENTATGSNSTTGASASTSETNASSLNVASDTPQGQINKSEILSGKYATATNANETNSRIQDSTSSTSRGNQETKENGTEAEAINNQGSKTLNENEVETYERIKEGRETGKTKSELIFEYRKNLMNVYERIIEELRPLFFALY